MLEKLPADYEKIQEDRYDNYLSLSRLYRIEIDAELLDDLCESPRVEPIGNADFDEGYADIRAYIEAIEDRAKAKSELASDYCWTFIGYGADPSGRSDDAKLNAAYPYESVYVTGSKTLTGGSSEGVAQMYRSSGFSPTRYRISADDHIACELELVGYLVGQEIIAAPEGDFGQVNSLRARQLSFVEEHLLSWVDAFNDVVGQRSETLFYSSLGRMTKGWLLVDAAHLKGDEDGGR